VASKVLTSSSLRLCFLGRKPRLRLNFFSKTRGREEGLYHFHDDNLTGKGDRRLDILDRVALTVYPC